MELINQFTTWGAATFGDALWVVLWALIRIVPLMVAVLLSVAYLTYAERKIIGAMQIRMGPSVVGPYGLLQPIADVVKLLIKEIITPTRADKPLYYLGPLMVLVPAFAVWAVIPLAKDFVVANIDASLLYVMSVASIGVYGVIWPVGRVTQNMHSSAQCAHRHKWCRMKSRWALRSLWY